jgi:hypothetical protein
MEAVASHYVTFHDLTSRNRGFDFISEAATHRRTRKANPNIRGIASLLPLLKASVTDQLVAYKLAQPFVIY